MKYEYRLIVRIFLALIIPYKIFYPLFTFITIYPSFLITKLLYPGAVLYYSEKIISLCSRTLDFVPACIAASAYYLLLLLILLTKDIKLKDRVYMFLIGAALILAMNIVRIEILIIALLEFGKSWFDSVHLLFWRFLSSVYVFLVWIYLVKKFKVKSIPVYSDLKDLYKKSSLKKKKRKRR